MFQQDITQGPGTGTFASHTFEILVMLLGAFLLGLWLGWVLWNRFKQEADRLRLENDGLQTAFNAMNTETASLKNRFAILDGERNDLATRLQIADEENAELRERLNELTQNITVLSAENRQLMTALNLDAGEETHIASLANSGTIDETPDFDPAPNRDTELAVGDIVITPSQEPALTLSVEMKTPVSDIRVERPTPIDMDPTPDETDDFMPVMEDHTPDFASNTDDSAAREMVFPTVNDHFSDEAFESLTRSTVAAPSLPTENEESERIPVFTAIQQDDLKIVEGIGPKIEQLLFKAGIHTYSELAAAPVSRLKEILAEAGSRYALHDPGTWSAQALLAANGEWDNLKAYQEFLDAGKRPT